jgi:hypothetical protein
MADDLKKFLKEQIDKRDAKAAKKREDELAAGVRRQAALLAELERIMSTLPTEVAGYATLTAVPPAIELNIPGCRPIRIVADGGGIFRALVFGTGAFPLSTVDDFADAIAAAVIDSSQVEPGDER